MLLWQTWWPHHPVEAPHIEACEIYRPPQLPPPPPAAALGAEAAARRALAPAAARAAARNPPPPPPPPSPPPPWTDAFGLTGIFKGQASTPDVGSLFGRRLQAAPPSPPPARQTFIADDLTVYATVCTDDPTYSASLCESSDNLHSCSSYATYGCADWVGYDCAPSNWNDYDSGTTQRYWGATYEQLQVLHASCPESCQDVFCSVGTGATEAPPPSPHPPPPTPPPPSPPRQTFIADDLTVYTTVCTDDPTYSASLCESSDLLHSCSSYATYGCADWVGYDCAPSNWNHYDSGTTQRYWGATYEQLQVLHASCPESCRDVFCSVGTGVTEAPPPSPHPPPPPPAPSPPAGPQRAAAAAAAAVPAAALAASQPTLAHAAAARPPRARGARVHVPRRHGARRPAAATAARHAAALAAAAPRPAARPRHHRPCRRRRPAVCPERFICLDTCGGNAYTGTSLKAIDYYDDQHCDDGGDGSDCSARARYGTDCADCGPRVAAGVYVCEEARPPPTRRRRPRLAATRALAAAALAARPTAAANRHAADAPPRERHPCAPVGRVELHAVQPGGHVR